MSNSTYLDDHIEKCSDNLVWAFLVSELMIFIFKWKIRGNFQDFQNFTVNTLDYSEISCIMSCELLNK